VSSPRSGRKTAGRRHSEAGRRHSEGTACDGGYTCRGSRPEVPLGRAPAEADEIRGERGTGQLIQCARKETGAVDLTRARWPVLRQMAGRDKLEGMEARDTQDAAPDEGDSSPDPGDPRLPSATARQSTTDRGEDTAAPCSRAVGAKASACCASRATMPISHGPATAPRTGDGTAPVVRHRRHKQLQRPGPGGRNATAHKRVEHADNASVRSGSPACRAAGSRVQESVAACRTS